MNDFQKFIDPEDVRELLSKLIRSSSLNPPGDVRECGAIIAEELKRRGLPAETIEEKPGVANVVSKLDGQSGGKTMIWNGHFDVVAPGEDWDSDPFSAHLGSGLEI
jgi:acetylornithine deacetylase/succinyl-diaminopimelate desuccinylase-like protein